MKGVDLHDLAVTLSMSVLHGLIFEGNPGIRFTLFFPDQEEILRPGFRYGAGIHSARGAALEARQRLWFHPREGTVGKAALHPGEIVIDSLPVQEWLGDRAEFERRQVEVQYVSSAVASQLSEKQEKVEVIVACAYVDLNGRLDAVLSIDFWGGIRWSFPDSEFSLTRPGRGSRRKFRRASPEFDQMHAFIEPIAHAFSGIERM